MQVRMYRDGRAAHFLRKLLTEKYTEYEFGTLFDFGGTTKPNRKIYDYEKEIHFSPDLHLDLRIR